MKACAALKECKAQLAAAERCYRKKLDELNGRILQQAAERKRLDQRRAACFQRLQNESCLIRNQLQACRLFSSLILTIVG